MKHYTLEELKAMGPDAVNELWMHQVFPFDLARCGLCATMHQKGGCPEHREFTEAAHTIPLVRHRSSSTEAIYENLEAIYALRLFFDSLYPQPEPQAEGLDEPTPLAKRVGADIELRGVEANAGETNL